MNSSPTTPFRVRILFALGCVALALSGCVGQVAKTPPPPFGPTVPTTVSFGHVFIVVEENTNYSDVIGSPSMPYLNSLANQYGLASNYFANLHPSIPDYFELTAGKTLTIIDAVTPDTFPVNDDNVVRELLAAGKTWKSYAEDLPSVGYTGGDTGNYAVRHNPLAYFTDVQNNSTQSQNLVPFSQFPVDLPTANLRDYSFIVPNLCNDAHDCPLSTADTWLKNNIDPLIKSPVFRKDGLLIIVFDEANDLDLTAGGGHVAAVVISPFSKPAYKSVAFYQHQSVLRLMLEGLGVTKLPGDAATAPAMWEFFTAP
jgi:phospholipase C